VIGGHTAGNTLDALIAGCATTAGRLDEHSIRGYLRICDWVPVQQTIAAGLKNA
jgi:hypothetical protein